MADYFGVAVIPARVRHPKDKAKVEAGVKFATTWIIAILEDQKFFSLAEISIAIKSLLERLNNKPFKSNPNSLADLCMNLSTNLLLNQPHKHRMNILDLAKQDSISITT